MKNRTTNTQKTNKQPPAPKPMKSGGMAMKKGGMAKKGC